MFKGSLVALITPMHADGSLDENAYAAFVDWQIREGTHGIVPVGTTGESPTLTHAEHKRVVEIAVEVAKGRVPVIAGAGSNSTAEAIDLTRHAKQAGADAALVVTPYYNKPTQEGLYLHYKAIAEAVDLPIIIYNIPPRSVVDMKVETMARLAKLPNIVGVKDATADLARPLHTRHACGADFCQLSGEDARRWRSTPPAGSAASASPATWRRGWSATCRPPGRKGGCARRWRFRTGCCRCTKRCSAETSPAPVKYAASLLGKTADRCRLPLAPIMECTRHKVRAAMTEVGLLN